MIVGLTGGIASGKSTVADFFRQKGIPVVDADEISHAVTEPDAEGAKAIEENFGNEMFVLKCLDRKKLAAYCFANKERTEKLNSVLHPIIIKEMLRQTEEYEKAGAKTVIWDVPLLFETGLDRYCSKIIAVVCNENTRILRAQKRSDISAEEVKKRISRQMSDGERRKRADYIIDNGKSKEETFLQAEKISEEFI